MAEQEELHGPLPLYLLAVSLFYAFLVLFIAPWDCPRDSICVNSTTQRVLLGVSRFTAYGGYPSMVLIFLTKCHFLRTYLLASRVSLYFDHFSHLQHGVHTRCGQLLQVALWLHGIFHIIRWAMDGTITLLHSHISGVTGVPSRTSLITLPSFDLWRNYYIKHVVLFEESSTLPLPECLESSGW